MKRRTFLAWVAGLFASRLREALPAITFDRSGGDFMERNMCTGVENSRMYYGWIDLSVESNRRRLGGMS